MFKRTTTLLTLALLAAAVSAGLTAATASAAGSPPGRLLSPVSGQPVDNSWDRHLNIATGNMADGSNWLDLGYVGFYAVGAYTVALLTSPDSPWNKVGPNGFFSTPWAWLSCVPLAMAHHGARRPDPRHPDAAAARRLPGDRHAGVRRDHPADGRQPGRHHQRPARPQRGRVPARGGEREAARGRFLQRELDGPCELRHLVVLARPDPDRRHPAARRQPGTQPGRPRLDRRSARTRTPQK